MKNICRLMVVTILSALLTNTPVNLLAQSAGAENDGPAASPWSLSVGGGYICYEGDEATKGGGFGMLRINYDYTPRWSFRGEVSYFPELKANTANNYDTGVAVPRPGLHGDSTWAAGLAGDALFHFVTANDRRWDPYIAGGLGILHYQKIREWRSPTDVPVRAGLGLTYNFTPAWAVTAELMGHMTIDKTEFNFLPNASISWRPGRRRQTSSISLPGVSPQRETPMAVKEIQVSVPAEDLRMFELDMNSAEGKWHEYFSELDAIAKIIRQYPDSEIWIEGHVDKQSGLSEEDAGRITRERADDVRDYFLRTHKIPGKRFVTAGYGFEQPKAPDDPASGNPENQRIVVRIRARPSSP